MNRRFVLFSSWVAGVGWLTLAAFLATGASNDTTRFAFCIAALFSCVILWLRIGYPPRPSAEADHRVQQRVFITALNAVAATAWAGLAVAAYIWDPTPTTRCLYALTAVVSGTALWLRIARSASAYAAGQEQGYEAGFARGLQLADAGRGQQPPTSTGRARVPGRTMPPRRLRVVQTIDVRRRSLERQDADS